MPIVVGSCLPLSLVQFAEVANEAFSDYLIPAPMTAAGVARRNRTETIDMNASRMAFDDEKAVGFAQIAIRGDRCRLAGMGVIPEYRRKGVARLLLETTVREARDAGFREMVLEVFFQNERARLLYEDFGFKKMQKLPGAQSGPLEPESGPIREIAFGEYSQKLRDWAGRLPWQLAPESVDVLDKPAIAYATEEAALLVARSLPDKIISYGLVVDPAKRRQGHARAILRRVQAIHPGLGWFFPQLMPESMEPMFAALGFEPLPLFQWEMALQLA